MWVRLNGTPTQDAPFIEIGCVVTAKDFQTLTLRAGSEGAAGSDAKWHVAVGDWSVTDEWYWNDFPGYKGGAIREPNRPHDWDIFREMMTSDADSMQITMGETYTFSLSGGIREMLAEKFPTYCYTDGSAEAVPTSLEDRYHVMGQELHDARSPGIRWNDGSYWEDGVSHELPALPLIARARVSESMTCIQAEALGSATFPNDIADSKTWHLQPNADEIEAEWSRRHAAALWGEDPAAVEWLERETFADWCGMRMQPE